MSLLRSCRSRLGAAELHTRSGRLRAVRGLLLQADGPDACVGDLCTIDSASGPLHAEVVAVDGSGVSLLAFGHATGLRAGAAVVANHGGGRVPLGDGLLGRVIGPFGEPLDGLGPVRRVPGPDRSGAAPSPMDKPPVREVLETGVRCVDSLLTLGRGQRVGLFAGSGVGKSTLLASIARHARSDVNVIALVGERSREVRAFVHDVLGPAGLARSVVVVSSADQPAPARVRAAHAAVAIATSMAQQGRHVLLMMDSITRLAHARREIGLAVGEPPTARGFTPSVFTELPRLCEQAGTFPGGGSVTALLTVLVDGDDLNDPVADSLRAVLDGHIVLSRELAQRGHYPPIDVLRSISRLQRDVATPADCALAAQAVAMLALLERHRDAVDLGLYQRGSNPALDDAIARENALSQWLRQGPDPESRARGLEHLRAILAEPVA